MLSWEDRVEMMLTYMAMPIANRGGLPPMHFDGALAMCLMPDLEASPPVRGMGAMSAPHDLPLAVEPLEGESTYRYFRWRKRGPQAVTVSIAIRNQKTDEWMTGSRKYIAKAGEWRIQKTQKYRNDPDMGDRIWLAACVERWIADQWTVRIAWDGCPSITMPTSPAGVIELFRLRDIPNGASRRAALLHWVKAHSRKLKDGNVADVRAHLRGQDRFTWNGLDCYITPSAADARHWRAA